MPGSKTGFKKCKYIMTRGSKAGKKCGANTKNDYCKHHTPKRLQQVKKYNEKICKSNKLSSQEAKLEYYKKVHINKLPNIQPLKIKNRMLHDEILYIYKLMTGIYYFLENEDKADKIKNILEEGKYGKCICKIEDDYKIDNLDCRFCFRTNTGEKIFFVYGEKLERTKKEKEKAKKKLEKLIKDKKILFDKRNFLNKKISIIEERMEGDKKDN